jgi:ArsR family transcriptional regulator
MKKDCRTFVGDITPFLKTVSEENRLKILCFLKSGEKCVYEIEQFLHLPQNLVSHHLKKLKDA